MTQQKPPKIMHKKHIARAEREAMFQRWVIGVSIGILVLIVGVIGYGYFDQNVLQPAQPVAKVGTVEISVGQFQKTVKYQRYQLIENYFQAAQFAQFLGTDQAEQIAFQLENTASLGRQVLSNMIDEEIIRQESTKRGISIPASEVDKNIQEAFGYYANGTPTPGPTETPIPTTAPTTTPTRVPGVTPTVTPTPEPTATLFPTPTGPTETPFPTATPINAEGYKTIYGDFTKRLGEITGYTQNDIFRLVESNLLREKLVKEITKNTPRETTEANSRHILVADEKTAKDIIERIKKGEDFVKLAAEFSQDTSNKDVGGALGKQRPGYFVPEFDAVIFSANVGLYPEPVKTTFGYHIIEILSREKRQMTNDEYEQAQGEAFTKWLTEQRSNTALVTEYDRWKTSIPKTPTIDGIQRDNATAAAKTATATAAKK